MKIEIETEWKQKLRLVLWPEVGRSDEDVSAPWWTNSCTYSTTFLLLTLIQ